MKQAVCKVLIFLDLLFVVSKCQVNLPTLPVGSDSSTLATDVSQANGLIATDPSQLISAASTYSPWSTWTVYSTDSWYYGSYGNSWSSSLSISLSGTSSGSSTSNNGEYVSSSGGSITGVILNSANLTSENQRCDELIAENLDHQSNARKTQPKVPTTIDVKVIAIALNDVSDVTGVVSMTTRIDFRWYDSRLAIPSNDSCDGQDLLIDTRSVWFPYFIIQNGAKDIFYPDAWEKYPSILSANGKVDWRVAFTLELSCQNMDVTIFPFDTQNCMILVQSPHYVYGQLNYTVYNTSRGIVLFNSDMEHPLWSINGQAVRFTSKVPGIQFWFRIQRKSYYYIWTIFIPIIAVSIQTGVTFVIPADGEEKVSTAVSGLLGYFFLFLIFTTQTPQTSQSTPALMVFYAYHIILTVGAIVAVAMVLRILNAEDEEEDDAALQQASGSGYKPPPLIIRRRSLRMPFIYETERQAGTGMEQNGKPDEPHKHGTGKNKKKKWFKLSASFVNDLCLVIYSVLALLSFLILIIFLASMYAKGSSLPITSIQEYQIGE